MAAVIPASAGGEGVPVEDSPQIAMHFLKKALDVLDKMNAPPELGARVQQALDAVAEYHHANSPATGDRLAMYE
jgi:hypothetical protein